MTPATGHIHEARIWCLFGVSLRFIRLVHGKENAWTLPPEEERRGTQILLARLADFVGTLRQGELLVLDEIDTSLHPDLCAALVALFTNEETNRKGAQLLFSTHDRDLLKSLRTDEVVLVDKGQDGASSLATASDYRGVRTREDLRRVHEEGRLRGVPVLGDLARAFGGDLSSEAGRGDAEAAARLAMKCPSSARRLNFLARRNNDPRPNS